MGRKQILRSNDDCIVALNFLRALRGLQKITFLPINEFIYIGILKNSLPVECCINSLRQIQTESDTVVKIWTRNTSSVEI
jgi:hypothetical protein